MKPPSSEVVELLRNFKENGFKFLLRSAANLRDLMRLLKPALAPSIDFAGLTAQRGTFIAPDFRHLESDLLLRAPLLVAGRKRKLPPIYLYFLIEHQSEPDELLVFRVLRYQSAIFEAQLRDWRKKHTTEAGFRFHPVLPVVIYSGTREWAKPTPLHELVEQGDTFSEHIPRLTPVFFNLSATDEVTLRQEAGLLGLVLHLLQRRRSGEAEFRALLEQVVGELEKHAAKEPARWEEMLWYIHAMVYHEREGQAEQLAEHILERVQAHSRKEKVVRMGKTAAERLMDRGRQEGEIRSQQRTLLLQLRSKFHKVPTAIERTIKSTHESSRLDDWLVKVLDANTIDDIGITPQAQGEK